MAVIYYILVICLSTNGEQANKTLKENLSVHFKKYKYIADVTILYLTSTELLLTSTSRVLAFSVVSNISL